MKKKKKIKVFRYRYNTPIDEFEQLLNNGWNIKRVDRLNHGNYFGLLIYILQKYEKKD